MFGIGIALFVQTTPEPPVRKPLYYKISKPIKVERNKEILYCNIITDRVYQVICEK
jgi:hypothetical protein